MKLKNLLKNFQKNIRNIILQYESLSCFIAGLFTYNAFNNQGQFIWIILGFELLIFILYQKHHAFRYGYLFGLGYFGSTLFWIINPFYCVGFGWLGYPTLFLLSSYLALFPGLSCYLASKLSKNLTGLCILLPTTWTLFEYIRGLSSYGFPWNPIAISVLNVPYLCQIADILGIYGVSLIVTLSITLLNIKGGRLKSIFIISIITAYGYYKIELSDNYIYPKKTKQIVMIQPAISQENKLNINCLLDNAVWQTELTKIALKKNKVNLIIWPEAAIDITLDKNLTRYITYNILDIKSLLITGSNTFTNNNYYNSALIINSNNEIIKQYDKKTLVPFGEFVPEWLLKIFKRSLVDIISFKHGTTSESIKIDGFEQFDIAICYEIIFPNKISLSKDSKWILNITNDAWFKSETEAYQHLQLTRYRAIEQGRAIARCNNSGISCVIDCNGNIVKQIQYNKIGVIDNEMPLKYCNTIFNEYKHKILYIVLMLLFILGLGIGRLSIYRNLSKLKSFYFSCCGFWKFF